LTAEPDWTPQQIEQARAHILYDVSEEALERRRREREQMASWGRPARCETGFTAPMGECLLCGAINGEDCQRIPRRGNAPPPPSRE
jgi:hypothetical protein